jgi:hypothetical protein
MIYSNMAHNNSEFRDGLCEAWMSISIHCRYHPFCASAVNWYIDFHTPSINPSISNLQTPSHQKQIFPLSLSSLPLLSLPQTPTTSLVRVFRVDLLATNSNISSVHPQPRIALLEGTQSTYPVNFSYKPLAPSVIFSLV